MHNQLHATHLEVMTLKQMNNYPNDYICLFIAFMFKKTFASQKKKKCSKRLSLKFSYIEVN